MKRSKTLMSMGSENAAFSGLILSLGKIETTANETTGNYPKDLNQIAGG